MSFLSVQDGCEETGVSVAFTVRAMDAGPILAQKKVSVDPDIDSPSLLSHLFELGTDLLLENLPDVWSGQAAQKAIPQVQSLGSFHSFNIQVNMHKVCQAPFTVLIISSYTTRSHIQGKVSKDLSKVFSRIGLILDSGLIPPEIFSRGLKDTSEVVL